MPYTLQSRLLRVLQEQQIVRVGGGDVISINVRVLAATNCNLERNDTRKRFREDLFFRLNVFPLCLPPLATRKADIIPFSAVWAESTKVCWTFLSGNSRSTTPGRAMYAN